VKKIIVLSVFVLSLAVSGFAQSKSAVSPFGESLFEIYGAIGAVSAQKRAEIVSENIKTLRDDPVFNENLLTVQKDKHSDNYNISYADKVIVSIDAQQSDALAQSKEEIANEYRQIIISAVSSHSSYKRWIELGYRILLVLLLIAISIFIFKFINKFYIRLAKSAIAEIDKLPKIIKKLLGTGKQLTIIRGALNILRIIISVFIIFIDCTLILSIFPETRWIAEKIVLLIIVPLKGFGVSFLNYIPNLFVIVIIFAIYYTAAKILKLVALKVADGNIKIKSFHPDWAMSTYNILRAVLFIFTVIAIFPHLPNSNSDVFKGMSVFIGLLLSLGSTSIINNIVSGFVITYMRAFQIGDRIKMGENVGNVIEKTALVTRIRTVKNEIITIPNSNIMTAHTINYTASSQKNNGLILNYETGFGYDVDWRKVHKFLIEAAENTDNILKDPKPFVLQTALDDFYVKYQINAYTDNADIMQRTYSELLQNIQDVFHREGLDLSLPHIRKHVN
jgi:small-conductance mechanosensitive channel